MALVGLVISGAREGLVLYLIFLLFLCFPKISYLSKKQKRIFLVATLFSILFLVIYLAEHFVYINFLLSVDDPYSYIKRLMMLLPVFSLDLTSEIYQFGIGASRFGVATKYLPSLRYQVDSLLPELTRDVETNFGTLTFVDSGVLKFLVEFGYVGLFLILVVFLSLSILVLRNLIFESSRSGLVIVLPFFIFILFLKGHSVISDIVMSSIFYFMIGAAVAYRRLSYS
jgi:O-antigen ligase